MKKVFSLIGIIVILALAVIAVASPNGILPRDRNLAPVQSVTGSGGTPATSRCDTVTGTKGIFQTYTSAGYLYHTAAVVDASGNPVVVKWYQDGKQVWVGSSFSAVNDLGRDFSSIAYGAYSGASRPLTSCIRRK